MHPTLRCRAGGWIGLALLAGAPALPAGAGGGGGGGAGAGAPNAGPALVIRVAPGVTRGRLAAALERPDVLSISPVFEGGPADAAAARRLGLDRAWRVRLRRGADAAALSAAFGAIGGCIEHAEPDAAGGVALNPAEPAFSLQWNMANTGQTVNGHAGLPGADIHVTPAWDTVTGDPDVILAVLDAGLGAHVELAGRLVPGRNVAAEPDNDDTSDACGSHGTHVAGIAAATGDNGIGVAGVDWRCRIMPVKVLASCSGTESQLAEGLVWAADHGADVINMSLQFYGGTQLLRDAVLYAHQRGVALVAAAGNTAALQLAYPARWPETIAVGAIDNTAARWIASNRGPTLDVMAPGADVWSLDGVAGYKYLSGTSMAAPHASGTIALLLALDPSLAPAQLETILRQTAVDTDPPGFDIATGYGRLDAAAAVAAVPPSPPKVPADLDGDGSVGVGDLLILLAAWGDCPTGGGGPDVPGCPADLDGDGTVGILDLAISLGSWG